MTRPMLAGSISVLLLALLNAGCNTDQRLAQQAERASDRQAEQNREIAHQNQQLAEATNRLVSADAQARQEALALQHDLQAERSVLDGQRDELEAERRQLATVRYRDPLIALALAEVGVLFACVVPLLLCGYLLRGLRQEPAEQELADLLVAEFTSDSPLLLSANTVAPSTPAITQEPGPTRQEMADLQP